MWALFSVMAQGWLGGAVEAAEELSGPILTFLALALSVTTLARLRVLAAMVVVLTVLVVSQGVAAVHLGYKPDLFLVQEDVDTERLGREWDAPVPANADVEPRAAGEAAQYRVARIRSRGVLADPNDLAQAIVAALPLLAVWWDRERRLRSAILVGLPLAYLLYGIYLTRSRGAVISLLVVLVVALHDRFGRIAAALAAMAALAGVAALSVVGFAGREVGIDESASGRTEAWATGLTLLRSSPVWGVGFGNFTEHHDLVAHNSFVHCFAEVGLVGYFAWLAILVLSWWEVGRVAGQEPWSREDAAEADWAEACRLALAGFVAAAFFLSRTYSVLLFLIVGLATAVGDMARRRGALEARGGVAAWAAGIASLEVATVILFFVVVRLSRLGE
jgi:hypothetical protein